MQAARENDVRPTPQQTASPAGCLLPTCCKDEQNANWRRGRKSRSAAAAADEAVSNPRCSAASRQTVPAAIG